MSQVVYNNVPVGTETEEASGLRSIILETANIDGKTGGAALDEGCAEVSGKEDDECLNYERIVVKAGALSANAIQNVGDGSEIGQQFEIVLLGALTGNDLAVTVANCSQAAIMFTMDAANETLLIRWNGACWDVLTGNVAS